MFKQMKNVFHLSALLPLFLIGLTPFSVLAENCTKIPVSGQVYSIINAGSGQALDIYGKKRHYGANAIQWPYEASRNQQFLLTDLNNGYWLISAEHSTLVLDVARKEKADGSNILQWGYNGDNNQQWQLVRSSNGAYTIKARHSGKLMSVADSKRGGNVFQQGDNGSANQLWYLNPVDGSCETPKPMPKTTPTPDPTPGRVRVNSEENITKNCFEMPMTFLYQKAT